MIPEHLMPNHAGRDVDFIKKHAKLIVDLRNMIDDKSDKGVKF